MKKFLTIFVTVLCAMTCLLSCRQSNIVSHNLKKEADYFNVARRIVVINARTDKPMFELKGYFSISNNSTSELEIVVEIGKDQYQIHYVYLNEWTLYVVEDLNGTKVSKYHYEIWYLPETILPSIKPTD